MIFRLIDTRIEVSKCLLITYVNFKDIYTAFINKYIKKKNLYL